jgi:hypothetical protein
MSIDDLLSQPLPAVADNGFSARVTARIRAAERSKIALVAAGSAVAVTLLCLVVPMETVSVQLNTIVLKLGTSTTLGLGGAALFLTMLIDRRFFRI